MSHLPLTCVAAGCLLVGASIAMAAGAPTTSPSIWPELTSTQKPWARWWWPGSAVDAKDLARLIEQFSSHGFGGVEVTPIYGVNGAEDRQIDFLSPKWMEMLKTAGEQAKAHGMQVDMATGTGWPFGGPW